MYDEYDQHIGKDAKNVILVDGDGNQITLNSGEIYGIREEHSNGKYFIYFSFTYVSGPVERFCSNRDFTLTLVLGDQDFNSNPLFEDYQSLKNHRD